MEEWENEKSVRECAQPAALLLEYSPDMLKLKSVTNDVTMRNVSAFVSRSHVMFMSLTTGLNSYFQFVKQTEEPGTQEVTVYERRFDPGYLNEPETVNVKDLSPTPKLKVGDVVLYKGIQPGNMSRFLIIVTVKIVKGSGLRNANQIQRFEYETKNLHDGSPGLAGKTVTEAQVIRCFFKGDVYVRVDGLDVLMCVVTEVCKACPFLVEVAKVTVNKADEAAHASSSGSHADVVTSSEYINLSVLESGIHMVSSHEEKFVPCVYFVCINNEINGTSSLCFRWATLEPKKMIRRRRNFRRIYKTVMVWIFIHLQDRANTNVCWNVHGILNTRFSLRKVMSFLSKEQQINVFLWEVKKLSTVHPR